MEQITNLIIINEKVKDHQGFVFHNFIDFKKAFDCVWHQALWHIMKKYNIGIQMTNLIKNLYENAKAKVLIGEQYSEWFRATVRVRQGCVLSHLVQSFS